MFLPHLHRGSILRALVSHGVAIAILATLSTAVGAQDSTLTSAGTPDALSLRFCGRSLGAGDGIVLGVLRSSSGTPRQGLQVAALWNEAEISRAGARTLLRASVDTSATDGSFVLCGVPRETALRVRAGTDDEGTGELNLSVPASGLLQRELVVGDVALVSTVSGRVVDAEGRALPALIALEGDVVTAARSDSGGAFILRGVPRRSGQVSIRAIGVVPLTLDLAPDGPLVELGDVILASVVQQMAELTVRERMLAQREQEFEDRRRSLGFGTFLDEATLRRQPQVTPQYLASRVPRAMAAGGTIVLISPSGFDANATCPPLWFVDGVDYGRVRGNQLRPAGAIREVQDEVLRQAVRVEIYRAALAPAEFSDSQGCGSVVVWTR